MPIASKFLRALLIASCGLLASGCYVFSAFQGARMVEPGKFRITPSLSAVNFVDAGESDEFTRNVGVQAAAGVAPRVNVVARYEHLEWTMWSGSHGFGEVGAKVGLWPERVAMALTLGRFFGDDVEEAWQLQPALFLTQPLHPALDLNLSGKVMHTFDPELDDFFAVNAGLGIRVLPQVTFLPEVGIGRTFEDQEFYWYWGLGAALDF